MSFDEMIEDLEIFYFGCRMIDILIGNGSRQGNLHRGRMQS